MALFTNIYHFIGDNCCGDCNSNALYIVRFNSGSLALRIFVFFWVKMKNMEIGKRSGEKGRKYSEAKESEKAEIWGSERVRESGNMEKARERKKAEIWGKGESEREREYGDVVEGEKTGKQGRALQ